MAQLYVVDLIEKYEPKWSLRSTDQLALTIPRAKRRGGDQAFVAIAPKHWSGLPFSFRSAPTLNVFKHFRNT